MKTTKFASMLAVAGGLAMATTACSGGEPAEQPAAATAELADDGSMVDNCAAAPCAASDCNAKPCAAAPCAAKECAAKPCAAKDCGAKPCVAKPCAAKK
ncbi:MAG: hypothetical protein U0987_16090 [Afipia sp.]|nr:hypothetical protein [Afipia sp.]